MTRQRRNQRRQPRKWSNEEDERLIRQVRSFPTNLSKCFIIVAEELGRSSHGVAAHWYTKVSKRPDVLCFFTASPKHVSRNRKNGAGNESNPAIWRRLVTVLRSLFG